jgi:hypothetical protein
MSVLKTYLTVIVLTTITITSAIYAAIFYYNQRPYTKDLVCCTYAEDIRWLHYAALHYDRVYLYIKNPARIHEVQQEFQESNITIMPFDNIGSCDTVYLHHIITHYNDLADRVAFLKGSCNLDTDKRYYYYYYLPFWKFYPDWEKLFPGNSWYKNDRDYGLRAFKMKYYQFRYNPAAPFEPSQYDNFEAFLHSRFTKRQSDNLIKYCYKNIIGGNFFVGRNNIQRYPVEMYERLVDTYKTGPNREIDHFQERLWGLLFANTLPDFSYLDKV